MKCPLCGTQPAGSHQFRVHFIGAHLKNNGKLYSIDQQIININKAKNILQEDLKPLNEVQSMYEVIDSLFDNLEPNDDENYPEKGVGTSNIKNDLALYLPSEAGENPPICREERQFAHRLATWLELGVGADLVVGERSKQVDWHNVQSVFFEATIMRDYWAASDRKNFNEILYKYVEKIDNEFTTEKYGAISKIENKHPNHWEKCHPLARWMMNAKPDLAVLTKDYMLHFIECKYESNEDQYSSKDGFFKRSQIAVQEYILDFAVNELEMTYNGNKVFLPYLKRLQLLQQIIQSN